MDLEENLLEHVLELGRRAQHPVHEAGNVGTMATEQLLKRGGITALAELNQVSDLRHERQSAGQRRCAPGNRARVTAPFGAYRRSDRGHLKASVRCAPWIFMEFAKS